MTSIALLEMEPNMNAVLGPAVREVAAERSHRTGAMVLEARFPTVLDRTRTREEVDTATRDLTKKVLEN